MKKLLVSTLLLASSMGMAQSNMATDAAQAAADTVKIREVSYSCRQGGNLVVTYGFNAQRLPTYAEAFLGGKTRFMPINLNLSSVAGTTFGESEDSWRLDADYMELNNYHKIGLATVQDPANEITHKDCRVVKTRKIKG